MLDPARPARSQKQKARMKITHVEVHRIDVPAANPPFRWRDGLSGSAPVGDGAVLRIGTDEGAEGVALFARPGAAVTLQDLVDRVFREELLGADPFQREWLWHRVWELDRIHELPLPALGLIDIALWDLAGRVYNEPVWRLLGGFRDAIPAYASTSTFATTEEFLDVADQCLALGYRGIKLHA
jgi:L-alanine-DL-glutamate epimerase-like enolase superfamily enzyme